ncbi:MAG: hypothetical protein IJQ24_11590 [Synergistaceae bacterium]|nr:hypothetical protein [Synergistaceae bacterium]
MTSVSCGKKNAMSFTNWLSDNAVGIASAIAAIASSVAAIWGLWQSHSANRKSDEVQAKAEQLQVELNRIKEYFDACEQYGKVKDRIRDFERAMFRLSVFSESEQKSDDDKKLALYEARTSYQNLFNELNSFSALINHGIIRADEYMENTAIPVLKKYGSYQARMFSVLSYQSEKLNIRRLSQPDYGAFKEYDRFLREFMTEREYERVKEDREKADLRI